MSRINIIFGLGIIMLLVLPIANAAGLSIAAPEYITEGESMNINFSINSSYPFNGAVYLSYTNINSSTASASFDNSSFIGQFYNHSWSIKGVLPGIFSVFANLTGSSGETLAVLNKSGIVNSSMPKIIFASPSGIVSKDSATLIAKTDEAAACRYDTANSSYENLSYSFSNTGTASHNQTLSGLSQGEHLYYIRCRDNYGYTMNESFIIRFTVDLPPSAQISLSDSSPVKAGAIEITAITSENLENTPVLEYSFSDAPSTKKQISLAGSGSSWKGYLIVTELDNGKIGTFYFTATDSAGNVGTKITSGNIFVVDTTKPSAPQSVKAVSEPDGDIKLSWYYDGEESDYFNIYRTASPGVNYVDFYAKSNGSAQFIDTAAADKATYYYKISSIDKAGNEGPLSGEVYATSVNRAAAADNAATASKDEDVPKVLPPNLVPRVDLFIKRIDSLLIDVKDTLNKLEEKQGEKKELIKELSLIEKANGAKSKLESLNQQLDGFKSHYATEEELEQKLNGIDLEAKKIEKTTPKGADILEKSEFLQSISNEDIENASNELFNDVSFTQNEKLAYIKKNQKEKDRVNVNVAVKVVSVSFLDGSKEEKTIIRKKFTYQGQAELNDVLVIETIPKSIANNVNEIEFLSQKYEVLKEDPVVKFGFVKFSYEGEEIAYSLGRKINVEDAKNSKSVVLLSLNEIVKDSSKVTGLSIFSLGKLGLSKPQEIFVWIGILTIIGLTSYYLLYVKDYRYIFKKIKRNLSVSMAGRAPNAGYHDLQAAPDMPGKPSFFSNDSGHISDEDAKALLSELYWHVKDAKADIADRMLPLFATMDSKLESKGFMRKRAAVRGYESAVFANALIDKAHQHLNNYSYDEAVKLYPKISFIYQNLPKESRAEIYERCAQLHERMNNLKPIF